jgi:hypothetical protein
MDKKSIHIENIYASPTALYILSAAGGGKEGRYLHVPDYVYIT